eukprot:jgi/Hompol1/5103/HPOL_001902-RA
MSIAHNCPNLDSVCLAGSDKLTDLGVKSIVESCPQLISLDISGSNITVAAVYAISDYVGDQLKHLSLASCPFRKAAARMLADALSGFDVLESLDVSCTSGGIAAIRHLTVLSLGTDSESPIMSPATTLAAEDSLFFDHTNEERLLPKLHMLRLGFQEFVEETDCRPIFSYFAHITHLCLSLVGHSVTLDVLRSIGLGLKKLQRIDISFSRWGERNETIVARGIREFVAMTPSLQVLKMAAVGLKTRDIRSLKSEFPRVCFDLSVEPTYR